jgi:hypothetical protein
MATKKTNEAVIVPLRNTFVITMISAALFIGVVFIFIL